MELQQTFRISSYFKSYRRQRIIEYSKLEGGHKYHQSLTPGSAQVSPKKPTLNLRALPKCFYKYSLNSNAGIPPHSWIAYVIFLNYLQLLSVLEVQYPYSPCVCLIQNLLSVSNEFCKICISCKILHPGITQVQPNHQ